MANKEDYENAILLTLHSSMFEVKQLLTELSKDIKEIKEILIDFNSDNENISSEVENQKETKVDKILNIAMENPKETLELAKEFLKGFKEVIKGA